MGKKDELLFTVDESNNPLPSKPRREVHSKKYWHRTTQIWILNNKKQILCQRRSLTKDVNPGIWEAFFGGHVTAEEDYLENAIKEIQEELGLTISKDKLILFKIFKLDPGKEFRGVYFLEWNGDSTEVIMEKNEVEEVKWFPIKKLIEILVEDENKNWNLSGNEKEVLSHLELL